MQDRDIYCNDKLKTGSDIGAADNWYCEHIYQACHIFKDFRGLNTEITI